MYACIPDIGRGFFEGVCAPSNATAHFRDPPHPGLAYNILCFLNHRLLRGFTTAAICGMNGDNQCPYPPYLFPLITLIRAPALDI
jgi:hypothetical protein